MKKWNIRIMPRPEVLDVKGRAVLQMLKNHELPFSQVRVGRYIELMTDSDISQGDEIVKKALKLGLFNPLVEVAVVE